MDDNRNNVSGGPQRSAWGHALWNSLLLAGGEIVGLLLALVLGNLALFWINGIPFQIWQGLLFVPAWLAGGFLIRLYPGWGLNAAEQLRRLEILLAGVFGIAALTVFLSRMPDKSRITFIVAYLAGTVLVPLGRILMKQILLDHGAWGAPVVLYGGAPAELARVADALRDEPGIGYNPRGVFTDGAPAGERICGVPVRGGLEEVDPATDVAIVLAARDTLQSHPAWLERIFFSYPTVILLPDMLMSSASLWVQPVDLQGMLGLELSHNLLRPFSRCQKYFSERLLVAAALPVWLPLVLALAAAVWLRDRRNPFFVQERVGLGGRVFRAFKLRTMLPDAESRLQAALAADPALRQEWERDHKLRRDPRVTPLGRFLRLASLDELPQCWNVLRGEMALVGPRPLPEYHQAKLTNEVRLLREKVLPGITGLWQVSGRSEAGTAGMEKWDAYYVRNWSVWLDIVILVRTLRSVMRGRGAY